MFVEMGRLLKMLKRRAELLGAVMVGVVVEEDIND
jgi:hypothetical protein